MKSAKCNEHQNQNSEVFWAQKSQIQSKKYPKLLKRKSQCPLSLCTDSTAYLYCFHWDSSKKNQQKQELYFDYDCENCFNITLDDPSGT